MELKKGCISLTSPLFKKLLTMFYKNTNPAAFNVFLNKLAANGFKIWPNVMPINLGFYLICESKVPYVPMFPEAGKYIIWVSKLEEIPYGYVESK